MSDVNAFDPSTWGGRPVTGEALAPEPLDDAPADVVTAVPDAGALQAEWADLRGLLASAESQEAKALATAAAAKVEVSRLRRRLARVEDLLHPPLGGGPDDVVG